MTGNRSSSRPISWMLMAIFFSLLPISTAMFALCIGAGMLLIALPLADNHYIQAGVGFVVLTVILGWVLTPLAYRFLARAFPLKASGELNRASLRVLRVAFGVMLVICLALTLSCWGFFSSMMAPDGGDIITNAITSAMSYVLLTMFAIMLLCAIYLTYGLLKVLAVHGRSRSWTSQQFALFLRSFGSVSDSAALGPLVRAAGVLMRVALLSSPRQVKASWSPLTLAISGFSFRHPFRSVPVFLESTDSSWADDVRRLAGSARLVVIDITHRSPGLSQEIDILAEPDLDEKTVRFVELVSGDVSGVTSRAGAAGVVLMERSKVLRWLSLALGFTFTYLGFVVLSAFLVSIFDIKWSSKPATIVLWSSLLYSAVPAVWGAAELSPAAGFTRRSARNLVDAMKQKVSGSKVVARSTPAVPRR